MGLKQETFNRPRGLVIDIPQFVSDLWLGVKMTGGLVITIAAFGQADRCTGITNAATYYARLDALAAEIGASNAYKELSECSLSPAPIGVPETLPAAEGMTPEEMEEFWRNVEEQHLGGSQ